MLIAPIITPVPIVVINAIKTANGKNAKKRKRSGNTLNQISKPPNRMNETRKSKRETITAASMF